MLRITTLFNSDTSLLWQAGLTYLADDRTPDFDGLVLLRSLTAKVPL